MGSLRPRRKLNDTRDYSEFLDITVDYPGGSPIVEYCMQLVQYVSAVTINPL